MPQFYGKVNRLLPTAGAESAQAQVRLARYNELFSVPIGHGLYPLCQEGTYYKTINGTPDTGIAQTIQTSFSATNGVLSMFNNATSGTTHLVMDYIRLICATVGTSTTRSEAILAIDNINRYSSGGTTLTAKGANMDIATGSNAIVNFGAVTLASESGSVRRLSRFQLRTAIMVQFEEWIISFGRPNNGGFNTLSGTNGQRIMVDAGPVIIGPQHTLCLHLWNPGNSVTAPAWEVEMGWWER